MQRVIEVKYKDEVIHTTKPFADEEMNNPETIAEVDGVIEEHAKANDIEFESVANSPYRKLLKQV